MGITPRIRPPADFRQRRYIGQQDRCRRRGKKPAAFFKLERMCDKDVRQ